jgi:hypothetical protein
MIAVKKIKKDKAESIPVRGVNEIGFCKKKGKISL